MVLEHVIDLISSFFQDVSPISYKLGEKVITNCAAKLKSSLIEAVKSRDVTLDEYAEIVAYICESGYENLRHGCLTGTGDLLVCSSLLLMYHYHM